MCVCVRVRVRVRVSNSDAYKCKGQQPTFITFWNSLGSLQALGARLSKTQDS